MGIAWNSEENGERVEGWRGGGRKGWREERGDGGREHP